MNTIYKQKSDTYNIIIFNNKDFVNYNTHKTYDINNKIIDENQSYINDICKIISNKKLEIKNSNNELNFDLLYYRLPKFNTGLQAYSIFNFNINNNFLQINISVPTLLLFYNLLFKEIPKNVNIEYFSLDDDKYFDNLLIQYHNAPNSPIAIYNKIIFLRSFPIFNYIMIKLLKYYNNISTDLLDNVTYNNNDKNFTYDITFLNYLYFKNIDYYVYNIQNLINNNTNILSYLINIKLSLQVDDNKIKETFKHDMNNIDYLYKNEDTECDNKIAFFIIKNELINLLYINYSDSYFKISKIYQTDDIKFEDNIISDLYKNILSNIEKYNILFKSLFTRGLLRIYIEIIIMTIRFLKLGIEFNSNKEKHINITEPKYIEDFQNIKYKNINNSKIKSFQSNLEHIYNLNNDFKLLIQNNILSGNILTLKSPELIYFFSLHFKLNPTDDRDLNFFKPKLTYELSNITQFGDYLEYSIIYNILVYDKEFTLPNVIDNFKEDTKIKIIDAVVNNALLHNNSKDIYYNNKKQKVKDVVTKCINSKEFLIPLLMLYSKNSFSIDLLISLYNNNYNIYTVVDIYDRFINTINFVSYFNNNTNKSLITFLLFSNDKIRVTYNDNDVFTKTFSSFYEPDYDFVVSSNTL